MARPKMTIPTQRVLGVLLEDVSAERYGIEIMDAAELPSGTVHPILARLEGLGWVESRWEEIDSRAEGRPPRRYYRLTASGAADAREALARAYRPRRSGLFPAPPVPESS
jgi:PadR family transcriptional regulator PadR